jgi:hypothetical protein
MRTYTWAEIRTRIRQRVNKEKSQFVTDSEIDTMIEEAYSDMYDILVNTNENYFISSTTLTLTAGVNTYSLPTDWYKLKGVDAVRNGFRYQMDQVPWESRNKYNITTNYQSTPVEYAFYGNSLYFLPTPNATFTVTVYYVPAPPKYVSDSTTVDGVAGFEQYIVNKAATMIRMKEEKDYTPYANAAMAALQRMVNSIQPRDFENAISITDVTYYDV